MLAVYCNTLILIPTLFAEQDEGRDYFRVCRPFAAAGGSGV